MAVIARHNSTCHLCEELIIRWCDEIVSVDSEWVHAQCAEDQELKPDEPWDPGVTKPEWVEN